MKKILKELYIDNKLSTCEIAGQFGVYCGTIYKWLVKFGIKPRTISESRMGQKRPWMIGCGHPNWRGGKIIDNEGYVLIHKPEHPNAKVDGYMLESRLVMEDILGRYLTKKEIVHHEGRKDDNRPENLILFSSRIEHNNYHNRNKQ